MRLLPLFVLGLMGCGEASRTEHTTSPTPEDVAPTCDALVAQYREVLVHRVDNCTRNEDCIRYGGVDPLAICGGVTSHLTGEALLRIDTQLNEAGCARAPYSCPALAPRCVDGACGW